MTLKLKFLFAIVIMTSILLGLGVKSCSEKENVKETIEYIHSKLDYNLKANEVIQQIIIDESCGCILEIPNESMIELNIADNPRQDIRKKVIENLHLRDRKELDSMEKLTTNFVLDSDFLKQQDIRLIKRDSLNELTKDPSFIKACPNGVLSILKPIFNKEYKTAAVNYGYALVCITQPMVIYKFENGKWHK